jgi:multimeric flavodoxin WrbA
LKKVLIINGSLNGSDGNTGKLVEVARSLLQQRCEVISYDLAKPTQSGPTRAALWLALDGADGQLFATGTYWDSWGSPLQQFLEEASELEGTLSLLGKPTGVIVTESSCGGKGVLSRLQGVLSTFGVLVPPMSGMVYSMANHMALREPKQHLHDDLWCIKDVEIVCHNLLEALHNGTSWKAWDVDRYGTTDTGWFK